LYEFARRGESVERPSRRITIHRLGRIGRGPDHLEFDVRCSKGTYVRTLAADIAVRLGTIGYVESLRRLSIDPFDGCAMHTLEELSRSPGAQADRLFLPADLAFADLVSVQVSPECEKLLLLGQNVSVVEGRVSLGQFRAYGAAGRFLGLVEGQPDGRIKPARLFVTSGGRPG
jgi:tRNA pseudouridine55 synthase